MLNSKDEIIQLLKEHFNVLGIGIELRNKKLTIRDSLFNITIVSHLIIAVLVLQLISGIKGNLYLSPVLFLYAFIAYIIFWVDYKSVNTIEFDFQNKNVSIISRSFVRRLISRYMVPQPSTYYFEEIRAIRMNDNEKTNFLSAKHQVNVNLKNGQRIGLISFSNEVNSILFSEFATILIN